MELNPSSNSRPVRRKEQAAGARTVAWLILAGGLAAIGLATLGPVVLETPREALPQACLLCGEFGTVDFLLNVLLFVPFGLGLALMGVRRPLAVLAIVGLSVTIEALQVSVISGRDASLGDLIANSLGGLIGSTATRWWPALLRPLRRHVAWLAFLPGCLMIVTAAATAFLLRPAPAPSSRWWGQWAHELGGTAPFGGKVRDVRLNGFPVRDGVLPDQNRVHDVFRGDSVRFEAQVTVGPIPPRRAQVAAIADGEGAWVASMWQDGQDVLFHLRLRTSTYLVRTPGIRLVGALDAPRDAVVMLAVEISHGRLTAETSGATRRSATIPLSPSLVWTLISPWDATFPAPPDPLTAVFLVLAFAVCGLLALLWGVQAGRRTLTGVSLALALVMALGGVPAASGLPAVRWWEWIAAATGLVLAWLLATPLSARLDARAVRSA